ncbi:MAG: DUF4169 family protein [Novosphingobium sp.]|uniref:DUF4169 family protein n=1 Tax=Novosphingobium sp. TaxID=1874826 RepID=UPI003C7C5ED5
MADVINLRLARKTKARMEADKTAAANPVKHGQTKAERERIKAEAERAARELAGKRLED